MKYCGYVKLCADQKLPLFSCKQTDSLFTGLAGDGVNKVTISAVKCQRNFFGIKYRYLYKMCYSGKICQKEKIFGIKNFFVQIFLYKMGLKIRIHLENI